MKPLSEQQLDALLSASHTPTPDSGFEERILHHAFAKKQKQPLGSGITAWLSGFFAPTHRWQLSGALAVVLVMIASGQYLMTPPTLSDDEDDNIDSVYLLDEDDDLLEI